MTLSTLTIGKTEFKLGCTKPLPGFVSSMPVFGEEVETLDRSTLVRLAKSPIATGRTLFPSGWIMNQGSYGSCNGWAAAAALRRARRRCGHKDAVLSGSYVYSLINGNRDNGSMLDDGMKVITNEGVATVDLVSPSQIYRKQYDTAAADRQAKRFKAFECYRVETIDQLWTALALGWDCVVVVQAGNNFSKLDSNGIAGYSRGSGNHAVGADGLLWAGGEIVADGWNQWGLQYGDRGRMLLTARSFEQTIGVHSFYAIRSATEDGDDQPPRPIR
jgi:hypothetical protein